MEKHRSRAGAIEYTSVTDLADRTDLAGIEDMANRQNLLQQLSLITDNADGRFGISVTELDTGNSFGINQDEWFQAASTIKVPILAYLYQQIEQGKVRPDDTMTYAENDYEEGTGSIQYTDYGTQWTVAELAQKMMNQSDNAAKNMLIRLLGLNEIGNFLSDRGSVFDIIANQTTPGSMSHMLQLMYENKIVSPGLTDQMFNLMTNTYKEDELPRYLGNVRVAHKNGAWENSVSDVGIVFLPGKPYVISVYSDDNSDPDQTEATIGAISLDVYNYEAGR